MNTFMLNNFLGKKKIFLQIKLNHFMNEMKNLIALVKCYSQEICQSKEEEVGRRALVLQASCHQ